jgi:hypothetical protein
MSTFNANKQNKLFSGSHHSSADSNEDLQASPETRLSAFSIDRNVAANSFASNVGGAPLAANHNDPFVTTNEKHKEVKLSATASAFQPFGIHTGANNSNTRVRSSSTTPGTLEYLQKETLNAGEVDRFGTFTTDTGATRCMKVTSLYGMNAQKLVEASLAVSIFQFSSVALLTNHQKLENSADFTRKGAEPRVVSINHSTVFIREANIADAARVYTSLKVDNLDHLEVSYVSPAVYGQFVSPSSGSISSYEGQVSIVRSIIAQ